MAVQDTTTVAQEQSDRSDGSDVREATRLHQRWRWNPRVWIQWLHRWVTLLFGILLLVITSSGTIALFEFDLNKLTYPERYHVTPTHMPVSLDTARATVIEALANDPATQHLKVAEIVAPPGAVYIFYLRDADDHHAGVAHVDPGTGAYTGYYAGASTIWGWFAELHYSLFADEIEFTYPAWVPAWLQTFIGMNLAEFMLKNIALLLLIMVLTGAYLWWPGIKKLAYGFRVQRGLKGFFWHYKWHKLLGIVSLPFLCMWAITGLSFYDPYHEGIEVIWHALTFSAPPPEAPEVQSTPTDKPMISAETARSMALAAVPDTRFSSVALPTEATGTVDIWLSHGWDPYGYAEWPGQVNLQLDAYTGTVLDNSLTRDTSWGTYVYHWWFYPIHAGTPVPWFVRLIWAFFGLMPAFLAFTGVMQWWLKRQKRTARRLQRQATLTAAPGD